MEDTSLVRRWWIPVLRGVAAIAFAILTFISPRSSLFVLVILFGAYALVDGAFNLSMAFRTRPGEPRWGAMIFQGVIGIVAGILTLLWPGISALVLLMLIASWAVVSGIASLVSAVRLRKQIRHEWLLALNGILSVGFGVLLFLFPGAGALAVVLWIGGYALVAGALLLALGFRLRGMSRPRTVRTTAQTPPPAPA